ncbi:MAG: chemotaxis protein CheW [Lachnospiraceae bacterium]|nr:chemotaxis protein CheW [Lachnospiraceae bacterium]
MFGQQVIFSAANQSYGFDSMKVRTVESGFQLITIPGAPDCVAGFADFRGEIIPVCDIYKKFNLRGNVSKGMNTIFVNTSEGCLGCMVDEITEIGAVGEDLQMTLPVIAQNDKTNYVEGIIRHKNTLVTVVNPDKILAPEEWKVIHNLLKESK